MVNIGKHKVALIAQAICSIVLLTVAFQVIQKWQYQNDDYYITFTFARNVAEGRGFVYNGGAPILGTTTPLLALLLAFGSRLIPAIPIPALAIALGAMAWIGACWALYCHLLRSGINAFVASFTACGSLLWGCWARSHFGSEHPLFLFLLIAAVLALSLNRYLIAGILMGCLYLTRGEGILLLPMAIGWVALNDRKWRWSILAGFLIIVLPWSIYSVIAFNALFPNTLGAKVAQRASGMWQSIRDAWLYRGAYLGGSIGSIMSIQPQLPFLTTAWFSLPALGLLLSRRATRLIALVFLFPVVSFSGYLALNVAAYPWYTYLLAYGVHSLSLLGAAWLITLSWKFTTGHTVPSRIGGVLVSACLFALVLFPVIRQVSLSIQPNLGLDNRSEPYRALAQWFNVNAVEGDTVAYVEVGYLGYFSRVQVIDMAGLVTPGVTELLGRHDLGEVVTQREHPKYVVHVAPFDWLTGPYAATPGFLDNYKLVNEIQTELWNNGVMQIWKRL